MTRETLRRRVRPYFPNPRRPRVGSQVQGFGHCERHQVNDKLEEEDVFIKTPGMDFWERGIDGKKVFRSLCDMMMLVASHDSVGEKGE